MGDVFHLRCELRSHEEDVRCVCVTNTGLATGSRDKTIKLWTEDGPTSFALTSTFVGHTDFVSSLAFAPAGPTAPLPGGALISGSRDTSVGVWDPNNATMVRQYNGHQYQVAAVGVTPSGAVVSASLDNTVKVWRGDSQEPAATLEGHQAAVLSLAVLPDGGGETIATGSGDCTIRLWAVSQGKCTAVLKGHTDSVRGLAAAPGVGLVSASHDLTLKVWTLSGECLAELIGHTAIIYSVAVAPDCSLVASGAEDNTARVWRLDGSCMQTLEHPGCVWVTAFLPNGDLVTACSDGVARVWTRAEERRAGGEALEAFSATLAAHKEAAKPKAGESEGGGGGGLPEGLSFEDPASLATPGTVNGQPKFVMEGGEGVMYSWDAAKGEWEKVGVVMAGPDKGGASGGRKWHEGREWDYVFDVAMSDDAPSLKLAMDAGENPYLVADRFLERYELPTQFKDQIVEFITQNTGGSGGAASADAGAYVDPFTGAGAYVPPPPGGPAAPAAAAAAAPHSVTGGGVDPYTGSSAGGLRHLPAQSFLLFDAPPPVEGLRKKLAEFSAALATDPATDLAITDAEMAEGGAVAALLAGNFEAAALETLLPRLLRWPVPQLFPILDLTRIVVLNAGGAAVVAQAAGELSLSAPVGSLGRALAEASSAAPPTPATQQTALRAACNCFAQPPLQAWCRLQAKQLAVMAGQCSSDGPKGVRLGAASLLVNAALMLTKLPGDELEAKGVVVEAAVALLAACPPADEEPRYRALVALGTVLLEHSKVRALAKERGMLEKATQLQAEGGRVGEVAAEVAMLLRR